MNLVFYFLLVVLFLVVLLKVVSIFISERSILNREELSSYECGFEHHNVSRIPFSLRYFFLTLLFLLFDLEILLLLFTPYVVISRFVYISYLLAFLFILVLFLGLIYEWNDGTLEWINLLNNITYYIWLLLIIFLEGFNISIF